MSSYRSVTVTHIKTGLTRTYWVNQDGTRIFGFHIKTGKIFSVSPRRTGGHTPRLKFTWQDKGNGMCINVSALVWSAWNGDGVYLCGRDGVMTIDHIDGDHRNDHYTNLERVTRLENIRRQWEAIRDERGKSLNIRLVDACTLQEILDGHYES